jgi:hypothetical protein
LETEIEDYDDQQQGSEEENEATIAEELAYLQQENERLRLEEENMTRQRVTSHPCNTIQEESHAVASRTRERERGTSRVAANHKHPLPAGAST